MANPPQPEMLGGPTIIKLPEIVTCSHASQRGGYGPNEDLKHWNVTECKTLDSLNFFY